MSKPKPKKPWWKRGWVWVVAAIVIWAMASAVDDTTQQATAPATQEQVQDQGQAQGQQPQVQEQTHSTPNVDEETTKQAIKAMYESLLSTYQHHKKSYDEVAWARFMQTYNEQLDKLDQEIQNSDVNIRLKTAIGDLRTLALEMTAELQGRQADVETFKKLVEEGLK